MGKCDPDVTHRKTGPTDVWARDSKHIHLFVISAAHPFLNDTKIGLCYVAVISGGMIIATPIRGALMNTSSTLIIIDLVPGQSSPVTACVRELQIIHELEEELITFIRTIFKSVV